MEKNEQKEAIAKPIEAPKIVQVPEGQFYAIPEEVLVMVIKTLHDSPTNLPYREMNKLLSTLQSLNKIVLQEMPKMEESE